MSAPALIVEPLTEETYRPFGRTLGRPARPADIDKGWLGYWHALERITCTRNPVWGFLEVRRRPFVLSELERHCRASEVFIPMGPAHSVMAFARGGDPDDPAAHVDLSTLRLLRIDGTTAFVVERGVWHTPSFPFEESAGFLIALEYDAPGGDLDIRTFEPIPFEAGQE